MNGSKEIHMFFERSKPKHDEADLLEQADLNAMRAACLEGQNTRRDRGFVEMAAGSGQRVYALVTLRVCDVRPYLEGSERRPFAHFLLNPEIDGDGDKGRIEKVGRMCPFVGDVEPVLQWIRHHPLSDPEKRAELGAPDDFGDCYLFIGDLNQRSTDPTSHWGADSARDMLERRKEDTADLPGVKTVNVPVNPHNWRHLAYTKSKDLPIDEDVRRKVFGWSPGSDTGDRVYGHKGTEKAVKQFVEAHEAAFGDAESVEGVNEQVAGAPAVAELSPEAMDALNQEIHEMDSSLIKK